MEAATHHHFDVPKRTECSLRRRSAARLLALGGVTHSRRPGNCGDSRDDTEKTTGYLHGIPPRQSRSSGVCAWPIVPPRQVLVRYLGVLAPAVHSTLAPPARIA